MRRILADRCFQCHGGDAAARQAELRLDQRESALAGHSPAIVPGDAQASELWRRVNHANPAEVMPPPEAKKAPLTREELGILERWIEAGAAYEPHWAFEVPVRIEEPEPKDRAWSRGSIDRFILAKLEERGIAPAPEADRATLLRRMFLDLTGLPPSLPELSAYLADDRPDAFERVVDRILTEEPYKTRLGEKLASTWLDAARYADTNGIHTDNGRQMWLWRDGVVEAFRSNLPFDRFVTEQLAGDLLPDATTAQQIASGFNRNHVTTDEGGAIAEEYLLEYAVDRVSTTSSVFLGLTMGCARCHDHKYDPITQRDFYSLASFFNSVEEPGLYSQTADPDRAYEPFLEVPSEAQQRELLELGNRHADLLLELEAPLPDEASEFDRFRTAMQQGVGVRWSTPEVLSATSSDPRVLLLEQEDRSIVATGPLPDSEDYAIQLRSDRNDLRALLLEALTTPNADRASTTPDGAGRASHGNAVISRLTLEARPLDESADWQGVPLSWAWSDHTQRNNDFEAGNVIAEDGRGWAADGNESAGARNLVLLSEEPFGFEGGTDLRIQISFRSPYLQHSLGRVRFSVSPVADTAPLPIALGRWYGAGPFRPDLSADRAALYDTAFGPELVQDIAAGQVFGEEGPRWTFDARLVDGQTVALSEDVGVEYLGRTLHSPDARSLKVFLGSDDGLALYLNGEEVLEHQVDRGVGMDQENLSLNLRPGANTLVFKIVNTGGASGYAFRVGEQESVLVGTLPSAILDREAVGEEQASELAQAWRRRFFSSYRALDDERIAVEASMARVRAEVPRTMVMNELPEPRPAFVMTRGRYDLPDESRPVERDTPGFLLSFPGEAARNRLGLASWMTSPGNALFARVAVNRFWQVVFGAGIVRSSEDFGLQGDWPTHPELLDWLAIEFRESGWDVHALLRSIVLSSTYRQSSRARTELDERDPDNRWLARYPRRRLSAEQIRDLALYTSGLLVESVGGPSVKPYQPAGLWGEVAMLASNTRAFELGDGADLWRRSLYTYWKRAVPPPAMQIFDAPTRESCVVRRQRTNTPLQALVLWNDEQFVEAARVLAARTLDAGPADEQRIQDLFQRCTSRAPEPGEVDDVRGALASFRERFRAAPEDAQALVEVGAAPLSAEADAAELAAWTLVANALLNLSETLTQH